jgi:hypothetical protein
MDEFWKAFNAVFRLTLPIMGGITGLVLFNGMFALLFMSPAERERLSADLAWLNEQISAAAGPLFFFIGLLILLAMGWWAAGYVMNRAEASAKKITAIIARKKKKREYDAYYDERVAALSDRTEEFDFDDHSANGTGKPQEISQ